MTAPCLQRYVTAFAALFLFTLAMGTPYSYGSSSAVHISAATASLRLTPNLDALEDPTGTFTIERVSSPGYVQQYIPLAFRTISSSTGACWLRFTIQADKAELIDKEIHLPILDLGAEQPGPAQLYIPHSADNSLGWPTEWDTIEATNSAQFPLPIPPSGTVTCYLRLAGPPGLWFQPTIFLKRASAPISRTPSYTDGVTGLVFGLILLNFLLMALKRGESRFWLGLYGTLALLHTVTFPAPAPSGGLPFSAAWAILTPGLALVLFPHVGRHILQTWNSSQQAESTFRWLSAFGALLAIAPLIPGCSGLVRILPLWPTVTLLSVVPALQCCKEKIPGAKRFLLATIITASGCSVVFFSVSSPDAARLNALIPFACVALGMLILTPLVSLPQIRYNAAPEDHVSAPAPRDSQEIISRVSHDLRTPLHTITHIAETLSIAPHDTQGVEKIRTLQAAAGNLSTLINDLLDVNRAEKGRLQLRQNPFDLQRVLIEAHDIIQPQAEQKGLHLSWFMAPHLNVKYSGDADRLLQVLLNLLGNAIRFSDRGTVKLRVTCVPDSTTQGHLLFSIKDNGISIPLQNQYDVFEEFCQSPGTGKGRYGGAGLGLTIARELVGLMGGFMCIQSSPNHGTEVSFSVRLLPLPSDAVVAYTARTDDSDSYTPFTKPPTPQPSHILVADDVASNRQLIRFFLEGLSYSLTEARTGEGAVAEYIKQPASIVLVDADMPGKGGPSAVKAIRRFETLQGLSEVPILALASRPEESAAMLEAGSTATLVKPLSRMRLIEMVTKLAPPLSVPFEQETSEGTTAHAKSTVDITGTATETESAPAASGYDERPIPSRAHTLDSVNEMNFTSEAELSGSSTVLTRPIENPLTRIEPEAIVTAGISTSIQTNESATDTPSLDISLIPLIPGLLGNIDDALRDAHRNVSTGSPLGVQEAAGRLAGTAASFGLRVLERMARCVERAAMADDLDAILNLLPELDNMVHRNKRALNDIHRMHKAMAATKTNEQL